MRQLYGLIRRWKGAVWAVIGGLALFTALPADAQVHEEPVPSLYGPAGISARAVRQGSLGSCYFHATIGAIADRNPDALRRAIRDMGGSYQVKLVDRRAEVVSLDDVLFARRNRFDKSDGLWVTVLLRGLAQSTMRDSLIASVEATPLPSIAKSSAVNLLRDNDAILLAYDRAVRSALYQDGTIDRDVLKTSLNRQVRAMSIPVFLSKPVVDFLDEQGFFEALAHYVQENGELFGAYRAFGQGGLPARILSALDGPAYSSTLHGVEDARLKLSVAQRARTPVVASTGVTQNRNSPQRPGTIAIGSTWWAPQHAYTVLEYDAGADQVTLRNPWGDHPAPAGIFTLSMADFAAAYDRIDGTR